MAGRHVDLKTKADWQKLYRKWVGVPQAERSRSGPTCIHGIDVLENFRPLHVFGLEPATASADDIKDAVRRLAKDHHPDLGGDPRVMERLQKMRDLFSDREAAKLLGIPVANLYRTGSPPPARRGHTPRSGSTR
jgi:hypothetical protein